MQNHTVLIVEDELISAEYLKETLEKANYTIIDIVSTGKAAIETAHLHKPDIILMDIMLEDNISGCEAAVQIYQDTPECKIIFLTAYADDEMLDYADRSKAYGYLLKPYREKEILATIMLAFSHHTICRTITPEIIDLVNGYHFNTKSHRLYKESQEIALSKKGLKLIELLAKHKNSSVSHEQICQHIWGEIKHESTLRSLIHRIRNNIDEDLIQNVSGLGYKIGSMIV